MNNLVVINFAFVLFFGIALTFSFADILNKKLMKQLILVFLVFSLIQVIAYLNFGSEFLFKSYPFLTHLPLYVLLRCHYKKNSYIAGISVLSAYLFCTPRKWVGTFIAYFWNSNQDISYIVQILITIPLLIFIIKFVSPYVARLKFESKKILMLFISVPLIYYVLEYAFTVYTDLLYRGGAVIIEFMDASIVTVYFIFSIIYLKTLYEKKTVEVEQAFFKIIADQSKSEIELLRKAQENAAIHRHDLQYHLNYIRGCISSNNLNDALDYISETCDEMKSAEVTRYSENESLNLVLSSYKSKASEKNINMEIYVSTENFGKFTVSNLCILLSNAFENAIHACELIPEEDDRHIILKIYSKNNKLCIDIRNSCHIEPVLANGFPVSKIEDYGFGTKSMAHIVEKYKGVYKFSVQDKVFIFQATA